MARDATGQRNSADNGYSEGWSGRESNEIKKGAALAPNLDVLRRPKTTLLGIGWTSAALVKEMIKIVSTPYTLTLAHAEHCS
jgi:hypothetical protein